MGESEDKSVNTVARTEKETLHAVYTAKVTCYINNI